MTAYEGKYAPLLVQWWAEMQKSDEFARAVHSSAQNLDAFICYFRHTASLMFEADDKGIWFAASSTPLYDGAMWDVWIRDDKRHTASALKAIELSYGLALERFPNLFGITQQRELHAIHLKLGYTYGGVLKENMDGKTQYIYQLTREGWASRKEAAMQIRATKRQAREERIATMPMYQNGATA
jgi:hypothetical protein